MGAARRERAMQMTERVRAGDIEIDFRLHDFVRHEAAPGTGVDPAAFWRGFGALVRRLAPRNAALLARRDTLQSQIDDWHRRHPGALFDT
jgi:malate synthase